MESGTCIHCGAHFGAHYQYCALIVGLQNWQVENKPVVAMLEAKPVDQPVDQDVLLWLETAEYLLSKVRKRLKGEI